MNNLPVELYEILVKDFSISDLKSFCITNKKFMNYCRSDKKRLVKKYFKDVDDLENIKFLFKSKDELYEFLGKDLLEYLDEEYPVNQSVDILQGFGLYVSKNWEKYISLNPMIVMLWYVHTLKSKPSNVELKKLFNSVPKNTVKDILNYDKDWFNTDNIYAGDVFKYLQKAT
jgi:hypothetical protein